MNSSRLLVLSFATALVAWLSTDGLKAQDFPTDDPIIRAIWAQGMEEGSQVEPLAQALMDEQARRIFRSSDDIHISLLKASEAR